METKGIGREMSRKNDLERKGSRPMNKTFSNLGRHLILIIGALTILKPKRKPILHNLFFPPPGIGKTIYKLGKMLPLVDST